LTWRKSGRFRINKYFFDTGLTNIAGRLISPLIATASGRSIRQKGHEMTKTITREKPKFDGYQAITDKIVAALESGNAPWRKTWAGAVAFDPRRVTGERYRGLNVLLLAIAHHSGGYRSNVWMTYNQAIELGGAIDTKAQRSTMITFYKQIALNSNDASDDDNEARTIPMLRVYNVYNADQITGLPERFAVPPQAAINPDERNAAAERRLRATGANIVEKGGAAYYTPATDTITLPAFEAFESADAYLATMAHELIHWTSHKDRCDRTLSMARTAYAFEELVAEIGAVFACNRIGVAGEHIDNHAAYLANWLEVLRNDKRAIFRAASLAQKACDFILPDDDADATPPPAGDNTPATPDATGAGDAVAASVARARATGRKPAQMIEGAAPAAPMPRIWTGSRIDFADIKGQETAKRAMEIALAGEHSIALTGPAGCGKTMLIEAAQVMAPHIDASEGRGYARGAADLMIDMNAISPADLLLPPPAEGSDAIAARASIASKHLAGLCHAAGIDLCDDLALARHAQSIADEPARRLMAQASTAMRLTARDFDRIWRVALTIAALAGKDHVGRIDVAEALSYRRPARKERSREHARAIMRAWNMRREARAAAKEAKLRRKSNRAIVGLPSPDTDGPLFEA
jgi:antirestriction protein ArdC/energy-coupling factor transporter ATP-binding protein EcfA2